MCLLEELTFCSCWSFCLFVCFVYVTREEGGGISWIEKKSKLKFKCRDFALKLPTDMTSLSELLFSVYLKTYMQHACTARGQIPQKTQHVTKKKKKALDFCCFLVCVYVCTCVCVCVCMRACVCVCVFWSVSSHLALQLLFQYFL